MSSWISQSLQEINKNILTINRNPFNSSIVKEKSGFTLLNLSGDFQAALAGLQSHASQRNSAVKNYLSN